jgi:hypothetical protein
MTALLRRRPPALPPAETYADDDGEAPPEPRRTRLARLGSCALVAYVPLLLTAAGRVAADTKTYLYLDPDACSRAPRPCGTRTSASAR